jgi:hypothetical protein
MKDFAAILGEGVNIKDNWILILGRHNKVGVKPTSSQMNYNSISINVPDHLLFYVDQDTDGKKILYQADLRDLKFVPTDFSPEKDKEVKKTEERSFWGSLFPSVKYD